MYPFFWGQRHASFWSICLELWDTNSNPNPNECAAHISLLGYLKTWQPCWLLLTETVLSMTLTGITEALRSQTIAAKTDFHVNMVSKFLDTLLQHSSRHLWYESVGCATTVLFCVHLFENLILVSANFFFF